MMILSSSPYVGLLVHTATRRRSRLVAHDRTWMEIKRSSNIGVLIESICSRGGPRRLHSLAMHYHMVTKQQIGGIVMEHWQRHVVDIGIWRLWPGHHIPPVPWAHH